MYLSPHLVNWNYARISDSPTFPRSLPSIRCKRSKRHVFEFLIEKKKKNYENPEKKEKKKRGERIHRRWEERRKDLEFGLWTRVYTKEERDIKNFLP